MYLRKNPREGASEGYVEVVCPSTSSGNGSLTSSGGSSVTEPAEVIDEAVKQAKRLLDLGV